MKNNYGNTIPLSLCCLLFITFFNNGYYLYATSHAPANAIYSSKYLILIQQQVRGTVRDVNGTPLPGVTIQLKSSAIGTSTNFDGNYEIMASPNDTLIFSYVGSKTQEVAVNGRNIVDIQLSELATSLDAVTINAGYYTTTKRESTGSIGKVTAAEIEKQPVSNPLATLQGRIAGVNITQTTGVPGGGFDIQIRGTNSIGAGNVPLYIVDGVPFSSGSLGYRSNNALIIPGTISPLNAINPNDIKSIEVLKDADATAIYGSRGANGVVLITTKKGEAGKTRLDLDLSNGVAQVGHFADLMDTAQYLEMRREAFANDGITDYPNDAYDVNGTWDPNRYNNWQELLTGKTARQHQFNARLSGGSAQTRFLIGGSLRRETTVFLGDNAYKKASVLANINHKSPDDRLELNFSVNYILDDNDLPATDLTQFTRTLAPNAPNLYNDDGSLNWADNTWTNPLGFYVNQRYTSNSTNLISNLTVSYEIFKNLSLKSSFGYNRNELDDKKMSPSTRFNPAFNLDSRNSTVFTNTGNRESWIVEPQINYEKKWNELSTSILLGTTFQQETSSTRSYFALNFPSNQLLDDISAASTLIILSNQSDTYRYQAGFGRINLKWKQKYIVNLTGRRDGSSRFGTSNRFANFGAVGLAWIFSREQWLKDQNVLSFGKLRGSYGKTGNDQIGNYEYLDTYTLIGRNYAGLSGLSPTQLFNPKFGWETNKKFEVSLELGFFEDRISSSVAFFLNHSGNQLVGIPVPGTTGFTSLRANLNAEVENRGWEIEVQTVNLKTKDLNWNTSFNITIPENELLSYPGLEGSVYAYRLVVGESLNIVKLYELQGVNPETGIYDFVDFNKDGTITSPDDRQYIQNLDPRYFGGFNNEVSYKNWNLSFLFQFVAKDNYSHLIARPGSMVNQTIDVLDRWQNIGDNAMYQRYSNGGDSENVTAYNLFTDSNGNYVDASFIRLKNIYLGYKIPKEILKSVSAQLYLQGQNIFTITDFKGADPESNSISTLPPLQQITMGIQLSF